MSMKTKDLVAAFKKKPVVAGAVAIGLILALVFYFRMDAPDEADTKLTERSSVLAKLKANVTNSAQLEAHLKALTDINDFIASTSIKPTELTQNQAMFFALEASTGVKLTNFAQPAIPTAGTKPSSSNYVAIPFSFDATGDYIQVFKCLQWVERNRTLSRITNAGLRGEKDGTITMNVKVELLGLRQ